MATAQNFFSPTPAPDPRMNPLAAGLAGGLQGASNYGAQQQQMQMSQQQQQAQAQAQMIMEMARQGKFGLGQGGQGTSPMGYAGMNGYYDPNGMTSAEKLKAQEDDDKGSAAQQHVFATSLLSAIASGYHNAPNQSNYASAYGETDEKGNVLKGGQAIEADLLKAQDNVNKRFGYGKYAQQQQQEDQQPQTKTAAQNLFESKTAAPGPSGVTNTPRARQLDARTQAAVQAKIDGYLKDGQSPKDIKRVLGQQGIDASKFTYQPGKEQ